MNGNSSTDQRHLLHIPDVAGLTSKKPVPDVPDKLVDDEHSKDKNAPLYPLTYKDCVLKEPVKRFSDEDRLLISKSLVEYYTKMSVPRQFILAQKAGVHYTYMNKLFSGKRKWMRLCPVSAVIEIVNALKLIIPKHPELSHPLVSLKKYMASCNKSKSHNVRPEKQKPKNFDAWFNPEPEEKLIIHKETPEEDLPNGSKDIDRNLVQDLTSKLNDQIISEEKAATRLSNTFTQELLILKERIKVLKQNLASLEKIL